MKNIFKIFLLTLSLLPNITFAQNDSLIVSGNNSITIKNGSKIQVITNFDFLYEYAVYGREGKITIKNAQGNIVYSNNINLLNIKNATTESQKLNLIQNIKNSITSCNQITTATTYLANTYSSISIAPVNNGVYTLQTGINTPITGITDYWVNTLHVGLINNQIIITPTGGSTLTVCTRQ